MTQIKKTLSIFMAALFVMAGFLGNVTAKAAVVVVPAVNYVGIGHSPLIAGDTEEITVTAANYDGKVQYRAFIYDGNTKIWSPLSTGYSIAVDAKTPHMLVKTPALPKGQHKISVWVKKADTTGTILNKEFNDKYDNYYAANLNCVDKDDANRVYASGDAKFEVNGLTVKFNGVEGMKGIEGPYLYRLNMYDANAYVAPTATTKEVTGWTKRLNEYTEGSSSYTFKKAGTYMVVAHITTKNSPKIWANYVKETDKSVKNQGDIYGTYEAWKTFKVTVTESTLPTAKVEKALYNPALFSTYAQVSLNTITPENYEVTINGVKAVMFTDKNGKKLFDANINGEVKSEDIKVVVKSTVVVLPTSKVEKALYNGALFSTYVQVSLNTPTSEKYEITINGVKAAMFTNKDGIKLFDASLNGDVKTADVVVVVTAK